MPAVAVLAHGRRRDAPAHRGAGAPCRGDTGATSGGMATPTRSRAACQDLHGGDRVPDVDRPRRLVLDRRHTPITVPPCPDPVRIEERLWGIPVSLCYLPRGDFGIHAAAVEVAGSGILLAAPGRFGKTTLAAAFLAAGHRVLSEDLSCCRLAPGPFVLPGPAMLRVRRDVYDRMAFPGTYAVAQEPHRVHLALEEHLRGNGHPVPLRAIVFLREWDAPCRLERLSPEQALQDLWSLAFKLPTDEDRARRFGDLVSLADQVAVWNVHRPLTFSALPNVIDAIIGTCLP